MDLKSRCLFARQDFVCTGGLSHSECDSNHIMTCTPWDEVRNEIPAASKLAKGGATRGRYLGSYRQIPSVRTHTAISTRATTHAWQDAIVYVTVYTLKHECVPQSAGLVPWKGTSRSGLGRLSNNNVWDFHRSDEAHSNFILCNELIPCANQKLD
jgi:hypothetical protein